MDDPNALIGTVNPHSRVFDDESSDWVQYDSLSDALIAKFYLETQIPARYTDAFLRVLRNPYFDTKQLSFRTSADIDRSVAEYRYARAGQRASACVEFPSRRAPRLPYDVFALIVDAIARERLPLRTDYPLSAFGKLPSGQRFPSQIGGRLKALALTHRAITPLAQRTLGQRLFVQKVEDLLALTRSPLLGPWTTELVINLHFALPASKNITAPQEILDCTSAVLQRATGLRFLRIRTSKYLDEADAGVVERLLEAVRALGRLETLWWIVPEKSARLARVDLEYICRSVSKMPCLRRLVLRNVQRGWVKLDISGDDEEWTHHIEELSLADPVHAVGESRSLLWLLSGSSLRSLTLGLNVNTETLESILTVYPVLQQLHTLRLRLSRPLTPGFLSRIFGSVAALSMSYQTRTPVLHTLHLTCQFSSTWDNAQTMLPSSELSCVPRSVRSLHLGFYSSDHTLSGEQCTTQEDNLIQFLETEYRNDSGEMLAELEILVPLQQCSYSWSRLAEVCESKGCRFEVGRAM